MLLSEGQMSDHKGASLVLASLDRTGLSVDFVGPPGVSFPEVKP
jgi:hypothetical protein